MSDQCKNCTLRGNMKNCRQTPCNIRESWFAIEIEKAAQDEINRLDAQKIELEGQVAMLRDAVQRIVNDACAYDCHYPPYLDRPLSATAQTAEEYRKQVQADEREECAMICDNYDAPISVYLESKQSAMEYAAMQCATAIRARGEKK